MQYVYIQNKTRLEMKYLKKTGYKFDLNDQLFSNINFF